MRMAVIGVGHLGRHHARILAATEGVELAAVVDINQQRANEVAREYGARSLTDWRDVADSVDAVTVAAPTDVHASIAEPFLDRGVHVLVEKPMTKTTAEADRLIALAAERNVTLAVGH